MGENLEKASRCDQAELIRALVDRIDLGNGDGTAPIITLTPAAMPFDDLVSERPRRD